MTNSSQPKVYTAVVLFIAAAVLTPFIVLAIYAAGNIYGGIIHLLTYGLLDAIVIVLFIVLGIRVISRHCRSQRAKNLGTSSICEIIDKKVTSNRFGHPFFIIKVKYDDLNGHDYLIHDAFVVEDFYCDVKIGDTLECKVYDGACYINPEYPEYAF